MIPLRDNIRSRTFPLVNYILIVINAAVFIHQIGLQASGSMEELVYAYGVVPRIFIQDWTAHFTSLITSQFLHGGFAHVLGNMIYLYIFGDNVEDKLGHIKYFFFYIFCGVLAALSQVYFNSNSAIPMIGASGAIAGVLSAYFFYYPGARVMTFVPLGFFTRIIEVPAFFFLGFWFLMQTFSGTSSLYVARAIGHEVGGVAWWAHAGGFASGYIMAILSRVL